eukprot:4932233-Amphidinium_carterae.1
MTEQSRCESSSALVKLRSVQSQSDSSIPSMPEAALEKQIGELNDEIAALHSASVKARSARDAEAQVYSQSSGDLSVLHNRALH